MNNCSHTNAIYSADGSTCPDCGDVWRAPYFLRQCRKQLPEGWPAVGYRGKTASGKIKTVSAHDIHIKMLKQALKDYRAEYLAQRSPEVAAAEEFLRQSQLF